MDFYYKTTDLKEIQNIIKLCDNKGFLGSNIIIGTSLPNSIIKENILGDYFLNDKNFINHFDVAGINFCVDNEDYRNNKFQHLYGKYNNDNIMVGIVTNYDIEYGDVPKILSTDYIECVNVLTGKIDYTDIKIKQIKQHIEHVIVADLKHEHMDEEDGGQYHAFNISQDDEEENGIYVKFCSWDDKCKHLDHDKFINRKVKITIETID